MAICLTESSRLFQSSCLFTVKPTAACRSRISNMSPRNTVPSLNSVCLRLISTQLIYALSDEEGRNYEAVEKYLSGATYEILQELLRIILNSTNLDASIRFSCLELLLREDVKYLETGIFPQFYYEKILRTISARGKRLQQLNLKGVWVRDYPELLSDVLWNLKRMRSLIIPHMIDDRCIEAIGDLKQLIVLDISGEACFTSEGLKKLKSDMVQVLHLGNFGKINVCEEENGGPDLVGEVIKNLPNLVDLQVYSFTGKALHHIYTKNRSYKTKLKYLHDTGTTMDVLESIFNLTPALESIHLDSAEKGVIENLKKFSKLNSLKLTKPNTEDLLAYLRQCGDQIQTLKLNHNKNTSLDLSEICLNVPNLQTLECFQMKLSFLNLDTYFMSLHDVELLYCDVSDYVIKTILANAPFLKRIVVGGIITMTDGDVFRLCAESDFTCLEEIWFSYARCLTATSVELLMGHCPNLKVIGQLSGWDIGLDELDYLRVVIALTNTDLTLLPSSGFT